jgi:transcription initiation factor IIE alpha subunit
MKKPKANIQSQMTQKLIHLLSELETTDRQRMSSDGKEYLDSIWKLLGQPTYEEIKTKAENSLDNLEEEE